MGNGGDNREEEIVAGVVFRERREWLLEACMKKKWWLYMPVASVRREHHSLSDANLGLSRLAIVFTRCQIGRAHV